MWSIVAGIDVVDNRENGYPVFTDINACDVKADVIIDFSHVSVLTTTFGIRNQGTHSCGTLYNRIYRISSKRIKRGIKTNSGILFPQYVVGD